MGELPAADRARLAQVDTRLAGLESDPRFWEDLLPTLRAAQLAEVSRICPVLAPAVTAQLRRLTTVAGSGDQGFNGDNRPATTAQLFYPRGVAVDVHGTLYIADTENHRVRKVDTGGTITTVAGTGEEGFNGDEQPATTAQLKSPRGVAVDVHGTLYIADTYGHRVRKVDTEGIITTVAGTGEEGFNGDEQPATTAQLCYPCAVAVDVHGTLYIADMENHRVRKVDTGGTITTVAGTGEEGFSDDGRPATAADLLSPRGVAVDVHGNLYIADMYDHRVRRVDAEGTITTVAGTGEEGFNGDGQPATTAQLWSPGAVAVDIHGTLYIADRQNRRVRKVDAHGTITTVACTGEEEGHSVGDGEPMTRPECLAFDSQGNLYIADTDGHRIRRVLPQ
ncbi:NHL repeat-containing protein [Streptomyces sp. NPDC005529]|uniref:NHL repeat-containing protein n=1 Tax=Streptomyces sp. NPDC005529 TaxID=3364721 RepID=UPI0036AEE1C7